MDTQAGGELTLHQGSPHLMMRAANYVAMATGHQHHFHQSYQCLEQKTESIIKAWL